MKIKKFTASSMPDAMKTVKNELGNDAVILNSRIVFTGGILGFFRKKSFEVIAAVDQKVQQDIKPILKEKPKMAVHVPANIAKEQMIVKQEKPNSQILSSSKQTENILKEINELKTLIKSSQSDSGQILSAYPQPIQEIQTLMHQHEFSPSLKEKFTLSMMEKWFSSNSNNANEDLLGQFKEEITRFLLDKPFGGISFTKKYVNVIGPTGVGKTTTLAKIAADCILNHKKKVAFITTDTYRIGAIEQLKTYAQILNVPVEVCYSLEDFQTAKKKFTAYDVILIDTAGRNFRNKKYIEDLHQVIDFNLEVESFLVLALTAKQKDMEDIYQQFSSIQINKFIFTKVDETSAYGSMMNMVEKFNIGVAYITTGQNVPDDMIPASPEAIASLITSGLPT
ncbi:flagellar biosynthesis protein FlhF [Neobacillus sp. PS3-40]|uniref:flagellar biosynthesis protein FlhF n=1 Tax=Neobacillus sp. PS3-40 TaxID=3070679 RepID=UPI0027DF85F8|nr:flagellar biosynthesis protein FlhF [Neobacillus sp. PS3-40]WML43719.1 flagellar biosynthesis protein FlhF [Neobacillus sp. PS3-40]